MVLLGSLVAISLKSYADAEFLAAYGAAKVPWLLIANAGGFAVATLGYDWLLRHAPARLVDLGLLGVLGPRGGRHADARRGRRAAWADRRCAGGRVAGRRARAVEPRGGVGGRARCPPHAAARRCRRDRGRRDRRPRGRCADPAHRALGDPVHRDRRHRRADRRVARTGEGARDRWRARASGPRWLGADPRRGAPAALARIDRALDPRGDRLDGRRPPVHRDLEGPLFGRDARGRGRAVLRRHERDPVAAAGARGAAPPRHAQPAVHDGDPPDPRDARHRRLRHRARIRAPGHHAHLRSGAARSRPRGPRRRSRCRRFHPGRARAGRCCCAVPRGRSAR